MTTIITRPCLQKYTFQWQLQWLLNSFLAFHVIKTFIKNIQSSTCITFLHTEIEEDFAEAEPADMLLSGLGILIKIMMTYTV